MSSETAPTVQQAMAAVMRDVRALGKGDRNSQGGFNFRGIDATLNAIGPALRDHGVVPLPEVTSQHGETVEVGKNRTQMRMVTLTVRYTFVGPGGDTMTVETPGEAMDSGDKAVSKAMSVAYRTALLQTFALPTQERDPDEDTYERAPARDVQPEPPQETDEQAKVRALAGEIRQLGEQLGWDMATITADYAERYGGASIRDAGVARLVDYRGALQQAVNMPKSEGDAA